MKYVRVEDVERMNLICICMYMVYKHIKNYIRNTRMPREEMRDIIQQRYIDIPVRVSAR
jgi:hypothetical protein